MNIVWLSWKDRDHPMAGGAEKVSGEIMDRMVANGHKVRHITAQHSSSESHEITPSGIDVYRKGNKYSVYLKAKKTFKRVGTGWADIVIDEMNTLPFWVGVYSKKTTNVLLAYQLAREVWFYQMFFPLSLIGYLLEPLMLLVLKRANYKCTVTESYSSKRDIESYGFSNVETFRVGIPTVPIKELPNKIELDLVLSLGALRPMKRTLDAVKAFEHARDSNPKLRMVIAGDNTSPYGQKVLKYINNSRHKAAILAKGHVTNEERLLLMQKAAIILVTSIKEGWGLIVTEANSQGTPAVVYDVDGLRDSVRANETGVIVPNGNYTAMANAINTILSDAALYDTLRHNAWEMSKEYTFDNSYKDFMNIIREAE